MPIAISSAIPSPSAAVIPGGYRAFRADVPLVISSPMSVAFAVFTSDPNLLACELSRLSAQVTLVNGDRVSALGVGHYASDELLLQQYRSEGPPREVWRLIPQP